MSCWWTRCRMTGFSRDALLSYTMVRTVPACDMLFVEHVERHARQYLYCDAAYVSTHVLLKCCLMTHKVPKGSSMP